MVCFFGLTYLEKKEKLLAHIHSHFLVIVKFPLDFFFGHAGAFAFMGALPSPPNCLQHEQKLCPRGLYLDS